MTERRYVLSRMSPGRYLLPSNDARWLWRIERYDEDGSATWYDPATGREKIVRGTFWQIARRPMPTDAEIELLDGEYEFWSSDKWQDWESAIPTRREAVERALS